MGKKTSKTRTPKKDDRVVFAFRLTQAERDVLHKVAGPGGASAFVLDAALKAAARRGAPTPSRLGKAGSKKAAVKVAQALNEGLGTAVAKGA